MREANWYCCPYGMYANITNPLTHRNSFAVNFVAPAGKVADHTNGVLYVPQCILVWLAIVYCLKALQKENKTLTQRSFQKH